MRVVMLASAESDVKELRRYIIQNFSQDTWQKTYGKLKETIRSLASFPHLGLIAPELETLHLSQYRQVLSGMNRIVYEVGKDVLYIHIIVDSQRDLKSFLMHRLVR